MNRVVAQVLERDTAALDVRTENGVWDCPLTRQKTDVFLCLRLKNRSFVECKECSLGITGERPVLIEGGTSA